MWIANQAKARRHCKLLQKQGEFSNGITLDISDDEEEHDERGVCGWFRPVFARIVDDTRRDWSSCSNVFVRNFATLGGNDWRLNIIYLFKWRK